VSSRVSVVIFAVGVLLSCSGPETWTATVYPDRQNLRDSISLGLFPSRFECAAAAIDVLARLGALVRGDYECGLRCKRNERLPALLVCDTTERPIDPTRLAPGTAALESLHDQCMDSVASLYQPEFVTIPGQLKARMGLAPAEEVRSYSAFAEAVECLRATSTDVVPLLSMGPTEFEAYFNEHSEDLGLPHRVSRR
jgi:hypothetical protein